MPIHKRDQMFEIKHQERVVAEAEDMDSAVFAARTVHQEGSYDSLQITLDGRHLGDMTPDGELTYFGRPGW